MPTQSIEKLSTLERTLAALMVAFIVACCVAMVQRARLETSRRRDSTSQVAGFDSLFAYGLKLGSPHPRVRLVEFGDYECPACARLEPVLQRLREKFPIELATSFIHFPLAYHKNAVKASHFAECAQRAGGFAGANNLLFAWRDSLLRVDAQMLQQRVVFEDSMQFMKCSATLDTLPEILRGMRLGSQLKIVGTPTIVIEGTMYRDVPTETELQGFVVSALSRVHE